MDKTFMSQKWCRNQKEEGLYWYYIMTKANIERTWKIALLPRDLSLFFLYLCICNNNVCVLYCDTRRASSSRILILAEYCETQREGLLEEKRS